MIWMAGDKVVFGLFALCSELDGQASKHGEARYREAYLAALAEYNNVNEIVITRKMYFLQ
jgi:hypothetical protein